MSTPGARGRCSANRGSFRHPRARRGSARGAQAGEDRLPAPCRREARCHRKMRMGCSTRSFSKDSTRSLGSRRRATIRYPTGQDTGGPRNGNNFLRSRASPFCSRLQRGHGVRDERAQKRRRAGETALMASLLRCTAKAAPEPAGHLVTRWNQDPRSPGGSCSYVPVGQNAGAAGRSGMPSRGRSSSPAKPLAVLPLHGRTAPSCRGASRCLSEMVNAPTRRTS